MATGLGRIFAQFIEQLQKNAGTSGLRSSLKTVLGDELDVGR